MDISIQPVDQPFSVRLTIQKDQDGNVTLDIPSITRASQFQGITSTGVLKCCLLFAT